MFAQKHVVPLTHCSCHLFKLFIYEQAKTKCPHGLKVPTSRQVGWRDLPDGVIRHEMEHLFTNHPDGNVKERIIVRTDIGKIMNAHDIMVKFIVKHPQ